MLARHAKSILLLTGIITLSPLLAFVLPGLFQALNGLAIADSAAVIFLRHWGLEVACCGGLLIYAAFHPAVRVPVLVAALVAKAGMVYLLVAQWGNPALAGMRVTLVFDALCVVLYALLLLAARGLRHGKLS